MLSDSDGLCFGIDLSETHQRANCSHRIIVSLPSLPFGEGPFVINAPIFSAGTCLLAHGKVLCYLAFASLPTYHTLLLISHSQQISRGAQSRQRHQEDVHNPFKTPKPSVLVDMGLSVMPDSNREGGVNDKEEVGQAPRRRGRRTVVSRFKLDVMVRCYG